MGPRNLSVSRSLASTTTSSYLEGPAITSRSTTGTVSGPKSRNRPKTATSTLGGTLDQEIICAITESRGISPTVGLAFVNISTTEAVLCQIVDNQTYVKTLQKLQVFEPATILFPTTAVHPSKSKLYSIIETNIPTLPLTPLDRKYWGETMGAEYIQHLAFKDDVEAIKVAIGGNYFATCCFAATLKYIESALSLSFPFHSMRIKYEASEGAMMIDLSTIKSLELIQNSQNSKSKDCLFGLLNQTLTPMGSRLLRGSILQPLTERATLTARYDALQELVTNEEMFQAVRQGSNVYIALKSFLDVDRVLTDIIIIPTLSPIQYWEQSINNVILLKQSIKLVPPLFEALGGVNSELLRAIRQLCAPAILADVEALIDASINEDVTYQSKPLDLRNQRTYAVKAGVNGLLDVARTMYKEANADALELATQLGETHNLNIALKYDTKRQYYFHIPTSDLEDRDLPSLFINVYRRKNIIECQTLDLVKWSQKIVDSHFEVLKMSGQVVQQLIDDIRKDVAPLFKISEGIAMLDMLASFAQLVTSQDFCRPELTSTLAIKAGRHPIHEKIHADKFVPNDVYATEQTRFQIITGCNMSGKSTYIRSIALMTVMAQIGSFVPAIYASFPIQYQLFARMSMDDALESNVSTFAAEMRETAFILQNIGKRSLVIVDELGRGTSTRDGLAIAIAIAEALVESGAFVWFVTHFRDLARFLAERPGVVNLHLVVETEDTDRMRMLYKIAGGFMKEEHYGIALAKVIDLPPHVIDVAEQVSQKLRANSERKRRMSKGIIQARRKKLVFGLREQLLQAKESSMQGESLRSWLQKLQDEFVRRMVALDEEMKGLDEEMQLEEEGSVDESKTGLSASSTVEESSITAEINAEGHIPEGRYMMSGAL